MKKSWNTPELTVYGAVETLTQGRVKQLGSSDALNVQVDLTPIGGGIVPVGS
ncbi:MAG: hypothetical protein KAF91_01765 [Nostoc sp. TH1S01]|nr:hypothetical protein [Nostoc sp. TH1S01]